jgi:hypothetical protein
MNEAGVTGKFVPLIVTNGNLRRSFALSKHLYSAQAMKGRQMPAVLMWLIGIPIPIIILLYLLT